MSDKNQVEDNSIQQNELQEEYSKIVPVHDAKKITAIMESKGISKKDVVKALGYKTGNRNAFSRLTAKDSAQRSAVGLHGLSNLSELLGVDIFDIVEDKYKDKLASAKLEHCKNDDELNALMHSYEKYYNGRIGVFNSFPSMIYFSNSSSAQCERFNLLMNHEIKNDEYYPIRSILKFGFSNFPIYPKQQRIEMLDKFITTHTGSNETNNHRVFIIIDNHDFVYSPFAADCEILGKEMLIVAAPFYSHSVITIKSARVVKQIIKDVNSGKKPHIMKEDRTMKMLELLLKSMKNGGTLLDFVKMLEKESKLYNPVLSVLPAEFIASVNASN